MNWLPDAETRAAVLKHPFFLAGLAVVALLGLTAAVLVIIDSATGSSTADAVPQVVISPIATAKPGEPTSTPLADGTLIATTKRVTTVRFSPGSNGAVLGVLGKGEELILDGRSSDSGWFRAVYPPGSDLHGWIDADYLEIAGEPEALTVATPEPPVVVELPTQSAAEKTAIAEAVAATAQAEADARATAEAMSTPEPSDLLPNLAISGTTLAPSGKLFVTVVNQGRGPASGDILVSVFDAGTNELLGGMPLPSFTLEPGLSIDVDTGYVPSGDQTLLLIVDPNGAIAETDDTDNRATISVAAAPASPTPPITAQQITPVPSKTATAGTTITPPAGR